ncbi:MAG: hypothetical protein KIT72_10835 [Polyangiaceae bacterium]|nr:hypothetical protein [Polyangiaceae bacterium]MCW5790907.1 hypothetical protein [Polyangiaceae bacterium]
MAYGLTRARAARSLPALIALGWLGLTTSALAQPAEEPAGAEEPSAPGEAGDAADAPPDSETLTLEGAEAGAATGAGQPPDPDDQGAEAPDATADAVPQRPLPPAPAPARPSFSQRLVLETARAPRLPPDPESFLGQIRGEYQLRLTGLSEVPLRPLGRDGADHLGQTLRLTHWLRITPRFMFKDDLELVGQIDVPRGFVAGQPTIDVGAAEEPLDERFPLEVAPRWLYLSWNSPIGLVRVGQQPSHWGLGLLANDGDHPRLFGDYRGGSIVERILFATRPLGKDSGLTIALAGDLVFKDRTASLTDDERAWQGVLAVSYTDRPDAAPGEHAGNELGLYGVYRHQTRSGEALPGRDFDETLEVVVIDSTGRFNAEIPGGAGHVYGAYEVAVMLGSTNQVRSRAQAISGEREKIRASGGAAQLGAVITRGADQARYGAWVMQLEWGWASGDADPNDGTTRRFSFDPNHTIGLLMFSEALHWKTARAGTQAADPRLSARVAPGADLLPSDGAVFGATYLNPTLVYRPARATDFKFGAVIAQTTADFVDPVQVTTEGRFVNYDGGPAASHDLGLELDLGVEHRLALDHGMALELGAQGGVLFPGRALAGPSGDLRTQYLGVARVGLQF